MRTMFATLLIAAASPLAAQALPKPIATAAAASVRTAQDRTDDARRHGPEIAAFAGIKPGQTVADVIPGGGYWTRLFSAAVGPKGKVVDVWPAQMVAAGARGEPMMKALVGQAGMENVSAAPADLAALTLPVQPDVMFTSQNVHDFAGERGPGVETFARGAYAALKKGGTFVLIDHVGTPGTMGGPLHRIDPAAARAAFEKAGFKFAGESKLLAHAADDHSKPVFDASLRGNTDQFVYLFRK